MAQEMAAAEMAAYEIVEMAHAWAQKSTPRQALQMAARGTGSTPPTQAAEFASRAP